MENVLFKIAFPAEFHAQTAVEAALALHPEVARPAGRDRTRDRDATGRVRIIDKTGPLANPADRDHCLQYMVAVALLCGRLEADDYEDEAAADPRIDALRARMQVTENERFTARLLRSRQTRDRQCRTGLLRRRRRNRARRDRVSARASPAPGGGHSAAAREISRQPVRPGSRRRACERIEAVCADLARLEALTVTFPGSVRPEPGAARGARQRAAQ